METKHYDILIIGGGVVGATLYLALQKSPYRVLLIDKALPFDEESNFDARSIALSPTSVAIFNTLGLWDSIKPYAEPIQQIHVSEQGQLGKATLKAHQKPLGFIVEMNTIARALQLKLDPSSVWQNAQLKDLNPNTSTACIQTPSGDVLVKANLIVAADGFNSKVRGFCPLDVIAHDFNQTAIVSNIGLKRSHLGIAYERFTTLGPLALLPMSQQRVAMVFALPNDKVDTWLSYDDETFLKELQLRIGYRLGALKKIGQRHVYPLKQAVMKNQIYQNIVFLGNAAHTLHPIAGQGLNLSLRDVAMLLEKINECGLGALTLQAYQKARINDQSAVAKWTHELIKTFGLKFKGAGFLRGLGLLALDQSSLLQKGLSHYASGYAGPLSDLICGIPPQWEHERESN